MDHSKVLAMQACFLHDPGCTGALHVQQQCMHDAHAQPVRPLSTVFVPRLPAVQCVDPLEHNMHGRCLVQYCIGLCIVVCGQMHTAL